VIDQPTDRERYGRVDLRVRVDLPLQQAGLGDSCGQREGRVRLLQAIVGRG